jgi:hypothetical protein
LVGFGIRMFADCAVATDSVLFVWLVVWRQVLKAWVGWCAGAAQAFC